MCSSNQPSRNLFTLFRPREYRTVFFAARHQSDIVWLRTNCCSHPTEHFSKIRAYFMCLWCQEGAIRYIFRIYTCRHLARVRTFVPRSSTGTLRPTCYSHIGLRELNPVTCKGVCSVALLTLQIDQDILSDTQTHSAHCRIVPFDVDLAESTPSRFDCVFLVSSWIVVVLRYNIFHTVMPFEYVCNACWSLVRGYLSPTNQGRFSFSQVLIRVWQNFETVKAYKPFEGSDLCSKSKHWHAGWLKVQEGRQEFDSNRNVEIGLKLGSEANKVWCVEALQMMVCWSMKMMVR